MATASPPPATMAFSTASTLRGALPGNSSFWSSHKTSKRPSVKILTGQGQLSGPSAGGLMCKRRIVSRT